MSESSQTPSIDQIAAIPSHETKEPGKLKKLVAAGAMILALAGCSAPSQEVDVAEPTQREVATLEAFGIAIGTEGDADGLFNTREAVDVSNNQYEKDGGIVDEIGGLPNLVIGVPDREADGAPKGDGNLFETEEVTSSGHEGDKKIEISVPVPKVGIATTKSEVTEAFADRGNTQYERDFLTDNNTTEQARTTSDEVSERIKELQNQGYEVQRIEINGLASGEDHTYPSSNANIGEPSLNNQQLSIQRAEKGKTALDKSTMEAGVSLDQSIISIGGAEVEPTLEQSQQLQAAADSIGISVYELTEKFNTQLGEINPAHLPLLTEALTNNRGVTYEIHAAKPEQQTKITFDSTIIEVPFNSENPGPSDKENNWLFRIEIPAEALLVLLALLARKIKLPSPNLPSPGLPGLPRVEPKLPIPIIPTEAILPPVKTPELIEEPPIKPPVDNPPPQFRRKQRGNTPKPKQHYSNIPATRKQPRNHNFSKQSGRLAGGSGRQPRNKGGDRSGKRK
jgi:hypothetical protein